MSGQKEIAIMELQQEAKPVSRARRWLSYYLSFLMVFFQVSPAWSQALSDDWFQGVLDNEPLIQLSTDTQSDELYDASLYIDVEELATYDGYRTIEKFYELMENRERLDFGPPTYVPILVNGITTFIPTYPNGFNYMPTYSHYPSVGTPYVQTRLVANQLRELLNRTLIDPDNPLFEDEQTQLISLYDNALQFAIENPHFEFGQPLKRSQLANWNDYDFVWPELRKVNGEHALVPIVYLSWKTVAERKVEGIHNEIDGNLTANSLTIDGVNLQMGRDSFIQVATDLVNNQGSITSEGSLEIVAGGAVRNLSGMITSASDLSITAAHIENRTLVYRYDLEGSRGQYFGEIAGIDANNNLTLTSHGDIYFIAAHAEAGGNVTLDAEGNIWLGSEQVDDYGMITNDGWKGDWSSVDHMVSSISAGETLSLIAGGEIVVDAAEITSKGHIEILAGLGITVNSLTTSNQYQKKGTFGNTKKEVEAYKTVAMRALLDAGKSITLHTVLGDLTLTGSAITSVEGTHLSAAEGAINLLVAKENDHYSYTSVKESSVRTVYRQKGHEIQSVVYPTIVGGLTTDAMYGLNVEFGVDEADADLSLEEQLDKINGQEGLEWLQQVKDDPSVNWTEVETLYKEWNERQSVLDPAVMAVIVIVVAIATSGGGLAGMMGTASLNGATMVGLGSATTTLGVAGAAAASAAFTTLATQVAIGVANGQGVNAIEDGVKYVVSDDYLKNLAVTAVTAGVMHNVDAEFLGGINDSLIDTGIDGAKSLSFAGQATQLLTKAVVQAGTSTLINKEGSSEFEGSLIQNVAQNTVNELGQYMATEIGDAFGSEGAFDTAMRYVLHAGAGCIVGAANAGIDGASSESGCASGSGGAVIGELVGDIYKNSDTYKNARAKTDAFLISKGEKASELVDQYGYEGALEKLTKAEGKQSLFNDYLNLKKAGADIAKLTAAFTALAAGASADNVHNAAGTAYTTAYYNALGSDARDFAKILDAIGRQFERFEELQAQYGPVRSAIIVASDAAKEALIDLHNSLTPEQQKTFTYTLSVGGNDYNLNLAALGGVIKYLGATAEDLGFIVDFGLAGLTGDIDSVTQHVDQLKQGVDDALNMAENIDQMPAQIGAVIDDLASQGSAEAHAAMGELLAGLGVSGVGVAATVLTAGTVGVVGAAYASKRLLQTLGNIRKQNREAGLDTSNLDKVIDGIELNHFEMLSELDKRWSFEGKNHVIMGDYKYVETRGPDNRIIVDENGKAVLVLKLNGGLHTSQGLEAFIARFGYSVENVTSFGSRNDGTAVFMQVLENGVQRVQLPRESLTRDGFKAVVKVDDTKIKGIKTLWPESYSQADIASAVHAVVQQNPGRGLNGEAIYGQHNGVRVSVYLNKNTGEVDTAHPTWEQ